MPRMRLGRAAVRAGVCGFGEFCRRSLGSNGWKDFYHSVYLLVNGQASLRDHRIAAIHLFPVQAE